MKKKDNKTRSAFFSTEDWQAVWIGAIIIVVACIAVLYKFFDFSALNFSTWHGWENVEDKKIFSSLFANGKFWIPMIRTFLILSILFGLGVKLQGGKLKEFIPAFIIRIICSKSGMSES